MLTERTGERVVSEENLSKWDGFEGRERASKGEIVKCVRRANVRDEWW